MHRAMRGNKDRRRRDRVARPLAAPCYAAPGPTSRAPVTDGQNNAQPGECASPSKTNPMGQPCPHN